MLVARLGMITRSLDSSVSPEGVSATNAVNTWNGWYDLKHASAAFIATDGMYAGFAGAKTCANLAKDNQPWPSICALHMHASGHAEAASNY